MRWQQHCNGQKAEEKDEEEASECEQSARVVKVVRERADAERESECTEAEEHRETLGQSVPERALHIAHFDADYSSSWEIVCRVEWLSRDRHK